ncbi:MAG: phosphate ABC transporter permease PstA [Myxococcales bacterium]|nr:phosphate ABC transporter permease PstA [Myxococcales bacterium]
MRKWSRRKETLFIGLCIVSLAVPLCLLFAMLIDVALDGISRIDWQFLTSYPSRRASSAGILPGLVGSAFLIVLTAVISLPMGVGAAIYLEEYGERGRLANLIEVNIANLAGVPSVIYGLLGLEIFVRFAGLDRSLLAGALTLSLLVLPVVIMATREALRVVPKTLREAALALGATRWQMVWRVVLPMAVPGIMTGAILSISRALGETAPLVVIGALTYVSFLPQDPMSAFTALPIQIFNWVSRPQAAFLENAAAAILVLLVVLLLANVVAIVIRNRYQKRIG